MIRPARGWFKRTAIAFLAALLLAGIGYGTRVLLQRRRTFPAREADYYIEDPLLGHRHRPYARREFSFPEHPRGRIVMQTNNAGMRRDRDINPVRGSNAKRILLVGDSHLDGVVNNDESFSTLLEMQLSRQAGAAFEVLNVSAGYYGPEQYLKSLEAYRYLGAEHWIVGFYAGNDFLDAAAHVEALRPKPLGRPSGYLFQLRKADRLHSGAVAQLLNQAFYFKTFPEMRAPAVAWVENIFAQMQAKAAGMQFSLWVILIPSAWEVNPSVLPPAFHGALAALGLSESDLESAAGMRRDLAARLARAGVHCWDPTARLQTRREPLFWKSDLHLNVAGHTALAELFGSYLADFRSLIFD
jgi:hypothetical protein